MMKLNEESNAQAWELEVTCKNRTYLNAVVEAILKYGTIEFEVNTVGGNFSTDGYWDSRYTVLMWCSWFYNLKAISRDLAKIEKRLD